MILGPAAVDVAYFVGGALDVATRREHEDALLRGYHEELRTLGVDYPFDRLAAGYAVGCFANLVIGVAAAMLVERATAATTCSSRWSPAPSGTPRTAGPSPNWTPSRKTDAVADTQRIRSGSPFEDSIGFSRAVRVDDRVLVSGTGPVWPDGSCDPDPAAQARRCFTIVADALAEAGASLDDVVRSRLLLTDAAVVDAVSAVHAEVYAHARPAATMVVVAGLVDPRWKLEVEAEAVLPR